MRKSFYITFCLLFCLIAKAQEKPTLKISANVIHKDASPLYKATITVGSGYSSLPTEVMTLESLKQRYKQELEKEGFAFSELKESPNGFGYETLGQKKEGLVYAFTTTSMTTMRKFMKIRPLGVESIYVVSSIVIDAKETEELTTLALAQARARGTAIANAMGKKLGKIIKVEDILNQWGKTIETSVYYDRPADECQYRLDITFAIE
ncbi:MAG: hypothetical protein AAF717_14920 [Bacteroidota bacterium]